MAARPGMPAASIESYDSQIDKAPRSRLRRFLDGLGQPATADTGPAPDDEAVRLRSAAGQAVRMVDVDRRTAERYREENDRARLAHVRDGYGLDPDDADLYHLRIDSTVLPWDTCVDLVVAAARARTAPPADPARASADSSLGALVMLAYRLTERRHRSIIGELTDRNRERALADEGASAQP